MKFCVYRFPLEVGMSKKKEKIKHLKRKIIEKTEEISKEVKKLNETIPSFQEVKRDAEADLIFIENAPEDLIEEFGDRLITSETENLNRLELTAEEVRKASRLSLFSATSSSGSAGQYVDLAYQSIMYPEADIPRLMPILEIYQSIAEEKARKDDLPSKLNAINDRLGEKYLEARNNVELSRAGIINVNKPMIDMRSVLDQLWGGLVVIYRNVRADVRGSEAGKEIRKPSHRELVADALASDDQTKRSWLALLDSISQLQNEISVSEQGKNPLNQDVDKLNEFYTRWITHLNGAVNLLTTAGLID